LNKFRDIVIGLVALFLPPKIFSQFSIGLTASPLFSTNSLNSPTTGVISGCGVCGIKNIQTKGVVLYSAGFVVDYKFSKEFFISAKTQFSAKGWNEKTQYFNFPDSTAYYYSKDKYRFNYFEVPLYFVFSTYPGNNLNQLLLGVGGYVDIALSGIYKFHLIKSSPEFDSLTNLQGNTVGNLQDSSALIAVSSPRSGALFNSNTLNAGLTFLAGMKFEGIGRFDVTVSYGLNDILTGISQRSNHLINIGINLYYFIKP
jgi:hypothetical protein